MRCAVIGLGEAGSLYAQALLEHGYAVVAADPRPLPTPTGIQRATDVPEAVRYADLVLVLTGAAAATTVAITCAPYLRPGACYADFTTASPQTKREITRLVGHEHAVADVAILGAVVATGARTPLMVSGPGAPAVAELADVLGAPVEILADRPAGAAMAHKLLRSIFMKGVASLVIEAVEAGRAAGAEPWIRDQIAAVLAGDGHAVIDRWISNTPPHAERRAREMGAVVDYLEALGVGDEMSQATRRSLLAMMHNEEVQET